MFEIERREIEAAFLESTFCYVDARQDSPLCIGAETDVARYLKDIEGLVRKISLDERVHFAIKTVLGRPVVHQTPLGKLVVRYLELEAEILHWFPVHAFTPSVYVFFSAARNHLERFSTVADNCEDGVLRWVESMNNVVDVVRSELRSDSFRRNVNRHRRASNKNYASLIGYIDALFKIRSRLLVVRVDFGYSKNKASLVDVGGLGLDEVKRHREKLIVFIRKKLAGALVGHAWKLEYGLSKSYHYHCIFFLDGSLLRQDVTWGEIFGRIWVNEVTLGDGVSHNCNREKEKYRHCGIGMIGYADEEGRGSLKKAAMYLTKIEYYVRVVTAGKFRTFGRGEVPCEGGLKRGRPRMKQPERQVI